MIADSFSLLVAVFKAIIAALAVIVMSVFSFFGYAQPSRVAVEVATSSQSTIPAVATSSPSAVSETKKVTPVSVSIPKKTPKPNPAVVAPSPANSSLNIGASRTPSMGTSTQILSTSTESNTVGTTTLAIQSVPLLLGGTVHAGETVPVSYLQITNIGSEGALLKGFWITQSGSAPGESIIGLSTVDDKGGSRGLNGGTESSILFQNGLALAPTDAFFAPGQMRLFTIKAIMTHTISSYVGMQLMIDVASIETTAAVRGQFPIRGTTWTISQ